MNPGTASQAKTYPVDADGLAVPELFQHNIPKWMALPLNFRKRHSQNFLEKLLAPPKPEKQTRPGHTTFTTRYAKEWGKNQGWKVIDSERYDFRTKRSHDVMLGMDVLFERPDLSMVAVQGAGRSERKAHRERFEERGGIERAKARKIECFYVEFERGNKTPILVEKWC